MSTIISMGKLSDFERLDNKISRSEFTLKYETEVNDPCSEIRFKRDLTLFRRMTQDSSVNPENLKSVKRLSIYCRSTDGTWRDAFTKFCNHFRNNSDIELSHIYDVLKIYLQTSNCDLNDLRINLIAHGELVAAHQTAYTVYKHDIEFWLP